MRRFIALTALAVSVGILSFFLIWICFTWLFYFAVINRWANNDSLFDQALVSAVPQLLGDVILVVGVVGFIAFLREYRREMNQLWSTVEPAIKDADWRTIESSKKEYERVKQNYFFPDRDLENLYRKSKKAKEALESLEDARPNLIHARTLLEEAHKELSECVPLSEKTTVLANFFSRDAKRVYDSLLTFERTQDYRWVLGVVERNAQEAHLAELSKEDARLKSELERLIDNNAEKRIDRKAMRQRIIGVYDEEPLDKWLDEMNFVLDPERLFSGKAEDDPTNFLVTESFVDIGQSKVLNSNHAFIVGEHGTGKTFLLRHTATQHNTYTDDYLVVKWEGVQVLLENHSLAISDIFASLMNALKKTKVKNGSEYKPLEDFPYADEIDLRANLEKDWRVALHRIKQWLAIKDKRYVIIGIDNLDDYPEAELHPQEVVAILACFLRPELEMEVPQFLLRVCVTDYLSQILVPHLPRHANFDVIHLDWHERDLRTMLSQRIRYVRHPNTAPSFSDLCEHGVEDLLLRQSKTPRELLQTSEQAMRIRALKWVKSWGDEVEFAVAVQDINEATQHLESH